MEHRPGLLQLQTDARAAAQIHGEGDCCSQRAPSPARYPQRAMLERSRHRTGGLVNRHQPAVEKIRRQLARSSFFWLTPRRLEQAPPLAIGLTPGHRLDLAPPTTGTRPIISSTADAPKLV